MPTNYERGREAEYAARRRLLDDGYSVVLRMAQSRGPVDLVAIGEQNIRLVQVKRCEVAQPYVVELEALKAWQVPECCIKELWVYVAGERRWVIIPA